MLVPNIIVSVPNMEEDYSAAPVQWYIHIIIMSMSVHNNRFNYSIIISISHLSLPLLSSSASDMISVVRLWCPLHTACVCMYMCALRGGGVKSMVVCIIKKYNFIISRPQVQPPPPPTNPSNLPFPRNTSSREQ